MPEVSASSRQTVANVRLLVLDTHAWIWLANKDSSLSAAARKAINSAAESQSILLPAISVWEVAMLERAGRIKFIKSIRQWVKDALCAPGMTLAALTPEIAIESCNLPGNFHGDPADRLIVATARVEGAVLVTKDEKIHSYARQGHIRTLNC
jgi:PIN domain nuclease of toxin-antitoxin system